MNVKFMALALCIICQATQTYKAVVIVPSTDLVGEPLPSLEAYHTQPICGGNLNPFVACKRMHQLLFNEVVEVIEERNDQLRVAVPNFFFITQTNTKPHNEYWMLKKHVIPLAEIEKTNNPARIPAPISFANPESIEGDSTTLTHPVTVPLLNRTFSAGTRFVIDQENKEQSHYTAYIFDKKKMRFAKCAIPTASCFKTGPMDTHERIAEFVNLIRSWATLKNGFIPYVWGGGSFIAHSSPAPFTEITKQNPACSYFEVAGAGSRPQSGFDCTGLVSRAAQICGIPYFFKNSTTVAHYLAPLKKEDRIEEGDLVWIDRHVMIVASLEQNTILEARHYSHGYGKVQEIPLSRVFKGMSTFTDLRTALQKKSPLYRMDSTGAVRDTFREFKILKMTSVWDKKKT